MNLKLIIVGFILLGQPVFGQRKNTGNCKIEIYLLNKRINGIDSIYKMSGEFKVTKEDLQDTPFIKNSEIISYTIRKFKEKKRKIEHHHILLSSSVNEKIKALGEISLCCGLKYALVVNDSIAYGGYFWNPISSWGANAIISYLHPGNLSFVYMYKKKNKKDPRYNVKLMECLKKSQRLVLSHSADK